jgi:hypothetical protein
MSNLVAALAGLSAEEADRFFHDTDAETVVALAQATTDKDVLRLLQDGSVRAAALGSVLARLDEYAVPERLAAVEGRVAFRLVVPRRGEETYLLRFGGGRVCVVPPPESLDAGADVTITTGALEFVRMVTGGANAALLHLGDRLAIDGDELLALDVGGVFRVPGSDGVAVDPTALDPGDVAVAIAKVRDAHLHGVMAGRLREVVLGEVFRRLPDYVHAEKARRHRLAVGFRIGGRPDGQVDRYVVTLLDGRATVDRLDAPGEGPDRDATIALDGAQFLKLVTGHLSPVTAVMRGQLKVRGDVKAALTFSGLMDIPSA